MSTWALVCVISRLSCHFCVLFFPPLGVLSLSLSLSPYVNRACLSPPLVARPSEGPGAADGVAPWDAQQTTRPPARRDQREAEDHRRVDRVSAPLVFLNLLWCTGTYTQMQIYNTLQIYTNKMSQRKHVYIQGLDCGTVQCRSYMWERLYQRPLGLNQKSNSTLKSRLKAAGQSLWRERSTFPHRPRRFW